MGSVRGDDAMLHSIKGAAKILGVSPSLLRHAEAMGIIPKPQRLDGPEGPRVYDDALMDAAREWRSSVNASKRGAGGTASG
jgi:hypothetical protein